MPDLLRQNDSHLSLLPFHPQTTPTGLFLKTTFIPLPLLNTSHQPSKLAPLHTFSRSLALRFFSIGKAYCFKTIHASGFPFPTVKLHLVVCSLKLLAYLYPSSTLLPNPPNLPHHILLTQGKEGGLAPLLLPQEPLAYPGCICPPTSLPLPSFFRYFKIP